ncbi:hypothetical protein BJ944DRAFT_291362 [Cunninghamella echinulata]|nr:hypothetical protein BJ944DRAFT_291362 [Cunninghamella echinulata]
MPMQFSNNVTINRPVKRRTFDDDDIEELENQQNFFPIKVETVKRVNNLNQTFDPTSTSSSNENKLPSLTYASPDYRPLPRKDALWLQPVPLSQPLHLLNNDHNDNNNATTTFMEDDLTDEDDSVPTPCYQPHQLTSSSTTTSNNLHHKMDTSVDWVMSEQC